MIRDALLNLKARFEAFLNEWTDHPILCQLKEIVERILSLSIETPLKKVRIGLELLLFKSQIWEDVAASSVSISSELRQISAWIRRWQAMELESWRTLLERQAYRHAQGAHKTWFYIFRLISDTESSLKVRLNKILAFRNTLLGGRNHDSV